MWHLFRYRSHDIITTYPDTGECPGGRGMLGIDKPGRGGKGGKGGAAWGQEGQEGQRGGGAEGAGAERRSRRGATKRGEI